MTAPLPFTSGQTYASVQLRHETPDEPTHIDWMIASTPVDAFDAVGPLVTFRAPDRLDALAAAGDHAGLERIADHRPRYLDYEGPLSDDRGVVTRVWRGRLLVDACDATGVRGVLRSTDDPAASTLTVHLRGDASGWRCDFLDI